MGFTLREIADLTNSELFGDPDFVIEGVEDLTSASKIHLSFLASRKHARNFKDSKAGAFIVPADVPVQEDRNFLVNVDPANAFQLLVEKIHQDDPVSGFSGIHPTSVVHQTATIGKNVTIGPFAVIDRDCVIGDNSTIGAHSFIGHCCEIGKDCLIEDRVSLQRRTKIGSRVVIQSGSVIGGSGFHHRKDDNNHNKTVPHHGFVILDDDVEIGSNTVVDRGLFKATRIGKRSKLDSLIMIAHNIELGHDVLIVAQTGIAGSSKVGNHCLLAAQVGIYDHVTLEDKVFLGARSVARNDLKTGLYSGDPALPYKEALKITIHNKNLNKLVERVKKLESQLNTSVSEEISCP